MSNPKPVEGALVKRIVQDVWNCVDYDAEGHAWLDNVKAEAKVEAALSAAPAPIDYEKLTHELVAELLGTDDYMGNHEVEIVKRCIEKALAAAPARDGEREAALEEAAKLIIAKAATQYGNLSVRQVQELVREIRALVPGAAKEQADGQR